MIYQVRTTLYFDTKAKADEAVRVALAGMDRAIVVNPGLDGQQGCSVELIKCYHDETPTKPCVALLTYSCPG